MKMASFITQLFVLAAILFWSWTQTKLNRSMLKRIERLEDQQNHPLLATNNRLDLFSFTCPVCHRTSYHPEDIKHRYCGHCHAFRMESQEDQ